MNGGARYRKKGGGVLRATAAVQYAWMHQQRAACRVSRLCRMLEVSRSGYDEWLGRPPCPQTDAAQQVRDKGQRYGTRRLKPLLAQEGLQVSRRRIGRVLAQAGLRGKTRRKCKAPRASGVGTDNSPKSGSRT